MKRLLLLLCLLASLPAMGAGLIIIHDEDLWPGPPPPHRPPVPPIHPPRPMPPSRPMPFRTLEINYNRAKVKITDQIAVTSIEEEFYNPNAQRLEGTFMFPLPKGAQVNKFTMEIDGKQVEAELLAADKARGIYEDIVRRAQDPALLEYAGRDVLKARIFPIEPRSTKRITISYSQMLTSDTGLVAYAYPLNTQKYSATPLKKVSVSVDLDTKRPLKSIYSPSHRIDVRRQANHASIGYEATDARPDTDFQLFFSQEEGDIGVNLLAQKVAGQEGHFLLLASPGITKEKKTAPKDVTFVLDTSGSMAGPKMEQAKKALLFCVENLNSNDRFEIVRFSTEIEPLFDNLVEASSANRTKARDFIGDLKAIGGTAIDAALRKAMAIRPEKSDRPYVVIFLTDGKPTIGTTSEDEIVAGVRQTSGGNTRVFSFGIGTDVNTHLLDRITEDTRAFSQYVLPEEDIEIKLSSFFSKIKEPILANVRITFPDGVRATKLYPYPLPDLFKGEQLVLAGCYSGKVNGKIVLEGTINGETRKFTYDIKFPDEAADHEFVPRLWATRRVGYLLDEIRLRGENKELRDEVTELARRYGIVTPYTAYLIVEDEAGRNIPAARRSLTRLETDREAREHAAQVYNGFKNDKDGDSAVGGARFSMEFKRAENAEEAVRQGSLSAARAYAPASASPAPVTPKPEAAKPSLAYRSSGRTPEKAVTALPGKSAPNNSTLRLNEYSQQNQFVNGKSFFQNGAQWVDTETQKVSSNKTVRVRFNSPEYFDLLAKNPQAAPWFALGRTLQVVLNGTIYEIYE